MNPSDQKHSEYSEEWLSAYIDNELTDAQRAIVEQRIAIDNDARQLLNELQHMRGLISQLPPWSGGRIDHTHVTELSLHSESFPETLEQAYHSHDEASQSSLESLASRVNAAGDVARRDVSWWRPIALAACLALLTGGGIWWWQVESSTTTLATSARTTEPLDERADTSPVPQLQSAPDALGVEATEAMKVEAMRDTASRSDAEMSGRMGGGMGGAMMGPGAAGKSEEALETGFAEAGVADSSAEAMVDDSPSTARLQFPPPAEAHSYGFAPPASALRRAAESDDQNDGLASRTAEQSGLAKSPAADAEVQNGQRLRSLSSHDRSSAVQVQLAHSAGWSAAEVTRALQRLAPLLNVPSGVPSEPRDNGPVTDIPIALIAQRPSTQQTTPLLDVLSQQAVALHQVAPSEVQNYFMRHTSPKQAVAAGDIVANGAAGNDTAADDTAAINSTTTTADKAERPDVKPQAAAQQSSSAVAQQAPPTVALFVLREEAEQLLQAARQSGEMQANPVWITSANGSTTPAGPKQQVVLLFTPQ